MVEFVGKFIEDIENNEKFLNLLKEKKTLKEQTRQNNPDRSKILKALKDKYKDNKILNTRVYNLAADILFVEAYDKQGRKIPYLTLFGKKTSPTVKGNLGIKREEGGKRSKEEKETETSNSGWRNMKYFYGFIGDFFSNQMMDFAFSPELQNAFLKTSAQEELRLLYQPLIARLQILEKESVQGISIIDIERADIQFEYLTKTFNKSEKFLIHAEYNNKLGDILYYKNGFLESSTLINNTIPDNFYRTINECKDDDNKIIFKPISAYKKYLKGCLYLLKYGFKYTLETSPSYIKNFEYNDDFFLNGYKVEIEIIKKIFEIWNLLRIPNEKFGEKRVQNYPDSLISALSYSILDVADCILSFAGNRTEDEKHTKITYEYLDGILNSEKEYESLIEKIEDFTDLDQVICLYYLASQLFKAFGNFNAANSQRLKILYLLNEYCSKDDGKFFLNKLLILDIEGVEKNKQELESKLIYCIEKKLVAHPIRYSYRMYSNAIRPEIAKLRKILNKPLNFQILYGDNKSNELNYIYREAAVSADTMEFMLVYEMFKLRIGKGNNDENKNESIFSNPYNVPNKNYNRILQLHLKL